MLGGSHCPNLGKSSGSSPLNRQKLFLSYSKKNQWSCVKLNFIQLFFRNVFGCYKSTHLDVIVKKLNKVEKTERMSGCEQHIRTLWAKKNLIGLGNSSIQDARVIGFAERHRDTIFKAHTAHLINALYREGDIILVEGLAGDSALEMSYPGINPGCAIYGWEPKNINTLHQGLFKERDRTSAEVNALTKSIEHYQHIRNPLEVKDIDCEKEKLKDFIMKIEELNKYYKSTSPLVLNVRKNVEGRFEQLLKGTLDKKSGQHGLVFYCVLIRTLAELEKKQQDAFYNNMSLDDRIEIVKSIPLRNDSLVSEIRKHRRKDRRVFVIAGASHLLQLPLITKCEEVKKTLLEDQFIVLTRKNQFKDKVAKLNRDFKVVPAF